MNVLITIFHLPQSINRYGGTPFQNALSEKHVKTLTFFMKNGADLKSKTINFINNWLYKATQLTLPKN